MTDLIIIGAGPAGLTAAVYAARAGKSVLVLERSTFGGQMTYSPKIENYPGFAEISGNELADKMVDQVLGLGVSVELCEAERIQRSADGKKIEVVTSDGVFECRAVILAVGSTHRRLGIEGEEDLIGRGISFCAVCDGAFYADGDVAVVGGGNSAIVEALSLSKIAKSVTVIQNLANLTGESSIAAELRATENVNILYNSIVKEYITNKDGLCGLRIVNAESGEEKDISVDGAFLAIGLYPATAPFADLLELDRWGYAVVSESGESSQCGIFVAGDCRQKTVRQISTATSDGACAALAACRYLDLLDR